MNADELWYGRSATAVIARSLATPLSWLYRLVVTSRNALYDRGILRVHDSPIPVVSVGNLTVGGTGKTPFSAYLVGELIAAGHNPAVVMRGYGEDELHLHARMNPGVPVITAADRVAGIRTAARHGADVVVMDDGFQHRRAARALDIVLLSAERWNPRLRHLPAGPLRESPGSLARADLIVVTQKSASDEQAGAVAKAIAGRSRLRAAVVVAKLSPVAIVGASGGERLPLESLQGARVLAIAGVGDPDSFFAQLRQLGAEVTERRFSDHHDYSAAEVGVLAAESVGHKYAVTTGKDAVKLAKSWPANGSELRYLSQAVRVTEGTSLIAPALANLFQRATSII